MATPLSGHSPANWGGFSLLVRPAASTSRDGWRWDGRRRHYDERGPVSPRSRQAARRMDRPGELRQFAFLKIAHSIPCTLPPPCSARPALGGRTPWGPDRRAAPKAATHWVSARRHCSAPCCRGKVPPPTAPSGDAFTRTPFITCRVTAPHTDRLEEIRCHPGSAIVVSAWCSCTG